MTEHRNVLELDLPEIRDRDPYAKPCKHLVKTGADSWEEKPGRRESKTLLVNRIRRAVDGWRDAGYPRASDTTRRLLQFWFEEDHLLPSGEPFRYYFCQREAMETLMVREYVWKRCFGGVVELDDAQVRRTLNHTGLLDTIAQLFSRHIGLLTAEARPVKLAGEPYRLSNTAKFLWRRMAVAARKTLFNRVACYNDFEARFAEFLDQCEDIEWFAALAEWFTEFHVQYLARTGALRLYYPDFVVIQATPQGLVNWIVETKGREFEDTDAKAMHMRRWCEEVGRETGQDWHYLKVSQTLFDRFRIKSSSREFSRLLVWEERQRRLDIL